MIDKDEPTHIKAHWQNIGDWLAAYLAVALFMFFIGGI